MPEIIYEDRNILVCLKPAGVLSTDEPGGLPELLRLQLNNPHANLRTVHRLDRVVGGLMVLGRSSAMASELSRQIREGAFHKEYLAVVHGKTDRSGELNDYLVRDKEKRMTFVAAENVPGAQMSVLRYESIAYAEDLSLVRIRLITGRTHQIRCQFSSRGLSLVGDRRYGIFENDNCDIALWSYRLEFNHPWSGEHLQFQALPANRYPWCLFSSALCSERFVNV